MAIDSISSAKRRVMIVAGEASGDLHGSNLLRVAVEEYPQLEFFGVGGDKMRAAGCDTVFSSDELSVMGAQEVLASLPRIIRRFNVLKKILASDNKPDLLVLIDFPDFNVRLARIAKAHNVPVLYYITPKVWAWRSGRAATIAARVDRLALIFPFEPEIYRPFGVKADYVGNPLLDEFKYNQPKGDLRQRLGIEQGKQVVGIFPGSRKTELKLILPSLVETAEAIFQRKKDVHFLVPVAPSLNRSEIEAAFVDINCNFPITFVEENIYEVALACDAVLSVSGTVTLQLALAGTPMAIVYKVAPLSYAIGKRLIRVNHVGLTNIVAGRGIVREFLQHEATAQQMSKEIIRLLDDMDYNQQMRDDLADVRRRMGHAGCSARVAAIVAEMVGLKSL